MSRMVMALLVGLVAAGTSGFTFSNTIQPMVVYGDDNRQDVYATADAALREVADSTVAMIPVNRLSVNANGTVKLGGGGYGEGYGLCKDEPFYSQPTSASCSGFLIGEDLIATAGHCIQASDCANNSFVFGFKMLDASQANTEVSSDEVYRCKQVVAREYSSNQDYSIVKLDRPVRGHRPLTLQKTNPSVGDAMTVIGHPAGLPTKIAGGANVRRVASGYFVANLDTYGGNSGSAVFNSRTLEVAGILVRGEQDFRYDSARACTRSNVCPSDSCRGEDVTLISYVRAAIGQN